MSNLEIWNKHTKIPSQFIKKIQGKQYKGDSVNSTYVVRCLTEMFGVCGQGWGYTVLEHAFKDFANGDVLHYCLIHFWAGKDAKGFSQFGQTKAAYKTSTGGFMVDEDAPKKSLTDAITKAASHLGIAWEIYSGQYDDNKYIVHDSMGNVIDSPKKTPTPKPAPKKEEPIKEFSADDIQYIAATIQVLLECDDAATLQERMTMVKNHCEEHGRDVGVYDEIRDKIKPHYLKILRNVTT